MTELLNLGFAQIELEIRNLFTYAELINDRAIPLINLRFIDIDYLRLRWLKIALYYDCKLLAAKRSYHESQFNFEDTPLPRNCFNINSAKEQHHLEIRISAGDIEDQSLFYNIELLGRNYIRATDRNCDLFCAYIAHEEDALRKFAACPMGSPQMMAEKMYTAVLKLQLPYLNPPMQINPGIQKMFLPVEAICQGGACLDLSILWASLLGTQGIHPLLFKLKEHMLPGFWRVQKCFETGLCDNKSALIQFIKRGEICVFDAVDACSACSKPFYASMQNAQQQIDRADSCIAIDVWYFLSPNGGIRQIPMPHQRTDRAKRTNLICPHCGYDRFETQGIIASRQVCPACGTNFEIEKPFEYDSGDALAQYALRGGTAQIRGLALRGKKLVCSASYEEKQVSEIAQHAFAESSLEEVILPRYLLSIGDRAFQNCKKLRVLELPDTLSALGTAAFIGCSALERISIPGKVQIIPRMAFSGCINLQNVEIQKGVQVIMPYAFSNCSALRQISLPSSIRKISERAFEGCNALEHVEICSANPQIAPNAFPKLNKQMP